MKMNVLKKWPANRHVIMIEFFKLTNFLQSSNLEYMCLDGAKYRKLRATPYRSYWYCVTPNCPAYVVLCDLKGGSLKKFKIHNDDCGSTAKRKIRIK
ncbi:uncharacterized protein LOC119635057 [Glossina fuscipes]|uniref:Uncharacterized protein LOC119635057 n=1 Tax=Glossina fuscipes TaxID=7396 RepID=A0A8U0WK98_9MUSC|nr:uncharacterized protein LOC119635057 [Glossina fuscipes]